MCVAGFAVILYARLVKDDDGLLQIVGAEVYSVNIQTVIPEETREIASGLEKPEVRKVMTAIEPGSSRLLCEGTVYASLGVYSDYGALENPSVYSGRYPKHENEVAISGNLAKTLDKNIGDTIKISQIFQETTKEGRISSCWFYAGNLYRRNGYISYDGRVKRWIGNLLLVFYERKAPRLLR